MIRVLRAEIFKLRTTRLILGLLLAATALVLLGVVAQLALQNNAELRAQGAVVRVRTQEDLRLLLSANASIALFTLVLGVTSMTGEHRYGTMASTFLAEPRRWRVVAGKLAATALVGGAFGAVVAAVATVVAVAWLAISGGPVPFGWSVLLALLLTPPATGLVASLGVVIGAAVRNQLAAILAALGWVLVVENLISAIVPWAGKWLPYTGALGAIAGAGASGDLLSPWAGGLLLVGYVAAFGAVAVWIVERRDV
jgi:ABC-2 type transport system permease protein